MCRRLPQGTKKRRIRILNHIQRFKHTTTVSTPLYKKTDRQYNRSAMCRLFGCVWRIALRMQEAGVTSTLPLHRTFYCALLLNYTFFCQKVNAQIAIPHIILFQKLGRSPVHLGIGWRAACFRRVSLLNLPALLHSFAAARFTLSYIDSIATATFKAVMGSSLLIL